MNPLILAKTHTTKFILPLLVKDGITYEMLFSKNFVNAYITHPDFLPEYSNSILVLFADIDFIGNQYKLFKKEELDYYFEEETNTWKITYELEDEYSLDYINFISGNYSKLTEKTKQKILNFWKCNDESVLHAVLYKDAPKLQEIIKKLIHPKEQSGFLFKGIYNKIKNNDELYSSPNLNNEIDYYLYEEGSN